MTIPELIAFGWSVTFFRTWRQVTRKDKVDYEERYVWHATHETITITKACKPEGFTKPDVAVDNAIKVLTAATHKLQQNKGRYGNT